MRAKIEMEGEGAIEVYALPNGRDRALLVEIDEREMRDLCGDGSDEPDYEAVAEAVVEILADALDLDFRLVDGLRRAVRAVVEPGGPVDEKVLEVTI